MHAGLGSVWDVEVGAAALSLRVLSAIEGCVPAGWPGAFRVRPRSSGVNIGNEPETG